MKFNQEDLEKLLSIRKDLVLAHESKRDYKTNPNAIMKESDYVVTLEKTIKKLDGFLAKYVDFS